MKREGNGRRPFWVNEISLPEDIDVLSSFENGYRLNFERETLTVGLWNGAIEVEEVLVSRVVYGKEKTEDPTRITSGSRNEVGNGRRGGI